MSRSTTTLALLGTTLAGAALLVLPLLLAWMLVPYVGEWFGLARVDPTWNDGDAGFAAVGLAVVLAVLAGIACASVAIGRRRLRHPAWITAGSVVLALGLALIPVTLILQPR